MLPYQLHCLITLSNTDAHLFSFVKEMMVQYPIIYAVFLVKSVSPFYLCAWYFIIVSFPFWYSEEQAGISIKRTELE